MFKKLLYFFLECYIFSIFACANRETIFHLMDTIVQFLTEWGYLGLFVGSFVAGSVLPFSSETILIDCIGPLKLSPLLCLISASLGNISGGLTCYGIGRLCNLQKIKKYTGVTDEKLERADRFVRGGGAWMGFFAFIPILGSAISIVLGMMRANIWVFTLAMSIGKVIRYAIVIWGTLKAASIF